MPVHCIRPPVGAFFQHFRDDWLLHALHKNRACYKPWQAQQHRGEGAPSPAELHSPGQHHLCSGCPQPSCSSIGLMARPALSRARATYFDDRSVAGTYPLLVTALAAYSVWKIRPSGEKVDVERSYCTAKIHFNSLMLRSEAGGSQPRRNPFETLASANTASASAPTLEPMASTMGR